MCFWGQRQQEAYGVFQKKMKSLSRLKFTVGIMTLGEMAALLQLEEEEECGMCSAFLRYDF